jgi:hypothetical protein
MPASVVLKRAFEEVPWRWDDWAGQYFLSDLAGTRGLGPEFFAADERQGWYLLEDLGLSQDLGAILLLKDSRARLAASLLACGLAGLHAGTFGRENPYRILRSRLPGQAPERGGELNAWRRRVEETLEKLRGGLAAELAPVLNLLHEEMLSPREFLCLGHGDWSASSVWYGDAGPRFLDFRRACFRHALLDLAAWEWRCAANPPVRETLWREYLEELGRLGADRGPRFAQALARARAWMALEHLAWGERSPTVRTLLLDGAAEPGLEPLAVLAELL